MSPISEPADEVAEPDPGLEEAVRGLPAEARPAEAWPGRTLGVRAIEDAEAELADRALERVGEQDRLVAQELPAGAHLGDEALALGPRPRLARTAAAPGRRSCRAAPPTRGTSRCRPRTRAGRPCRGAPRRRRRAGSRRRRRSSRRPTSPSWRSAGPPRGRSAGRIATRAGRKKTEMRGDEEDQRVDQQDVGDRGDGQEQDERARAGGR